MKTTTVDLKEEAREIREEKLPAVEEVQEELINEFDEEYGSYANVPEHEEKGFDKLEEKRIELEGNAQALEDAVKEWGGGEFIIQELTTGALAAIQDEVAEKSFEFDHERGEIQGGMPKQGYGMLETLKRSIEKQPAGAPTKENEFGEEIPDPREYPQKVGLFLFEKINSFNTVGDTDLGNSSLRDRME